MSAPTPLTSKDVAEALNITPKELRIFLRSPGANGMYSRDGKSYVFTKTNVTALKKGYAKFIADRAATRTAKAAANAAKAAEPIADDANDDTEA